MAQSDTDNGAEAAGLILKLREQGASGKFIAETAGLLMGTVLGLAGGRIVNCNKRTLARLHVARRAWNDEQPLPSDIASARDLNPRRPVDPRDVSWFSRTPTTADPDGWCEGCKVAPAWDCVCAEEGTSPDIRYELPPTPSWGPRTTKKADPPRSPIKRQERNCGAFVVVTFELVNDVPIFRHVGIYSEERPSSVHLRRERQLTVLEIKSTESYQDALDQLMAGVKDNPHFAWLKAHIPELNEDYDGE